MTSYDERNAAAAAKVSRLPKWAQDYITGLERQASRAERELAEAKKGPADSNVFRVCGLRDDDQPIGRNADMRFQLGEHWTDSVSVRHDRTEPDTLLVCGDRSIVIEPRSGNFINVKMEKR